MERRGSRLSRRQFVVGAAGLGVLAGCGRLPGQARQAVPVHRLGYLSPFTPDDPFTAALQQGLQEHGYVEGQNLVLESRYAEGRFDRLPDLAVALLRLPVELLITTGSGAAQAAQQATRTLPIVVVASSDPVGEGLAASLAHPGGNVTGVSVMSPQLSAKRLEILTETITGLTRLAVLGNTSIPAGAEQVQEAERGAAALGLHLLVLEVRTPEDVEPALETVVRDRSEALLLTATMASIARDRFLDFAVRMRLPTMGYARGFADAGGLIAYGPSHLEQHRRAAYYVDRILKGARPADLPVEQPMTFEFVVNLRTAQALGITFPNEIMLQVTEVIQ